MIRSNIGRIVCRTPEEIEDDRQGAESMLRKDNARLEAVRDERVPPRNTAPNF